MEYIDGIPVWGGTDEGALSQIKTCAKTADHVALMADNHKGYAVPIGGVVAYEDKISPSGVGFDIACIVGGSRVTTADGYTLPVEAVTGETELVCWDGGGVRPVQEHTGRIATGVKPVLRLELANHRKLTVTADHRMRTPDGWKPAGELSLGDKVACPVHVGLPYEQAAPRVTRAGDVCEEMVDQALLLYRNDARLAALARLLGVVCGDGHVSKSEGTVSIYTTDAIDAAAMVRDFATLGHTARVYTRPRKPGHLDEIHVRVGSLQLKALFALLGSPVGRKAWGENPMPWLFAMPAWVRAQFLSAFTSAECLTPRPQKMDVPNLAIKQSGESDNALRFIGRLLESLCFDVTIVPSGPPRGERHDHVLQIVGGTREQVRFFEEIGFCYAHKKREQAAKVASIVWQRVAQQENREAARQEAVRLRADGTYWKDTLSQVSAQYGVSRGFVYHAIYDDRGILRRERGTTFAPDVEGEICWVPVRSVSAAGTAPVYDIATADAAHCFFAEGMVVHNCGNKAVLTDMPASEVRKNIKTIMDDVWNNLEFGIGRNNETRVEHELFDDETWKMTPMKSMRQMAHNQLGTIGSGVSRLA